MYFVFTGDPRKNDVKFLARWMDTHRGTNHEEFDANDPRSITMFATILDPGITFELNGEPVEVTDKHRIDKLRGNGHFTEVDSGSLEAGSGDSPKVRRRGRPPKTASAETSVP